MGKPSFPSILAVSACLFATTNALNAKLVGTWTSKSAKVLTGPSFYNPINDSIIEPAHPGISYSFTADGFYEEAYYRTISNPAQPSCPKTVLQFQHGTVTENPDGSLLLVPIAVDGRQMMSDPCQFKNSIYTRYNQTETFDKYEVQKDAYSGVMRLNLFQFDGTPLNPMYIAYSPAIMLPTQTMNPTSSSASATAKAKRGLNSESREAFDVPLNKNARHIKRDGEVQSRWGWEAFDANRGLIWWAGVGMTVFGGAAYLI